jgi:hypothetical protein
MILIENNNIFIPENIIVYKNIKLMYKTKVF